MLEVFSLLISFIVALGLVAFIYWAVMKLIRASGISLPAFVVVVIQVLFAIIAVAVLVSYGVPLLKALVP